MVLSAVNLELPIFLDVRETRPIKSSSAQAEKPRLVLGSGDDT